MSVYNGAAYLPAALDSILTQSMRNWELVIVDDASTDSTPDLLQAYTARDSRLKIIQNPQNYGLTVSLNIGLQACQGEFIARQDADDIALPTRLERQLAYFAAHQQAVLLGVDLDIIDSSGTIIGQQRRACHPLLVRWKLLFYNVLGGHSGVMFRRQTALGLGGYNETRRYSQDYELWLRMAQVGEVAILPEVLLHLRLHPQNISSTQTAEQEAISLRDSQNALAQVLGHGLGIDEVATLRRFWLGNYPSPAHIGLIQDRLSQLYRQASQNWRLDPPARRILRRGIAQQWAHWLRSVSIRQQPQAKLRLAYQLANWRR